MAQYRYVKRPKISLYAINFCLNFVFVYLFHKILDGKANSVEPDDDDDDEFICVDPDQTAPSGFLQEQSDLGLHCSYIPFYQTNWCSKF